MTVEPTQLRQPGQALSLGECLKSHRTRLDLTQSEVLARVNQLAIDRHLAKPDANYLPHSSYSMWESETRVPILTVENRSRLSLVLEVLGVSTPVDELISSHHRDLLQAAGETDDDPEEVLQTTAFKLLMDTVGINSPELAELVLGSGASDSEKSKADHQFRAARGGATLEPTLEKKARKALKKMAKERGIPVRKPSKKKPSTAPPTERMARTDGAAVQLRDLIKHSGVTVHFDAIERKFVDQNGDSVSSRDEKGPYLKIRIDPKILLDLIPPDALLDVVIPKEKGT